MTSTKNVFVPTANGIIEKSGVDHGEASGPRVGLRLTADQAAFILNKHELIPPICSPLTFTYVDRGFNNRTYVVRTEDPKAEFVIRLTGNCWTRMKTENEVAAISHLSSQTNLAPTLPTILAFSSSKERSGVGSEYIVMSKLRGVPLDEIFLGLSSMQKKKVLRGIAALLGEMKMLAFSSIGSLQFDDNDASSCGEGFKLVEDRGGSVYSRIVVGPGLEAGCGPFQTYLEYLRATCTTELKHLKGCPFLMEEQRDDESTSMTELIARIEKFVDVMCDPRRTKFGEDVTNVSIVFTHGDFEPRNMLVDEDTLEITGLVDFEFSGAFPEDDDWMAGFQWIGATTSEEEAFGDGGTDNIFFVNKIYMLQISCTTSFFV